jgi:hypothetical protein
VQSGPGIESIHNSAKKKTVPNLSGDICDRSRGDFLHSMDTCIARSGSLGFFVDRARGCKNMLVGLDNVRYIKSCLREQRWRRAH